MCSRLTLTTPAFGAMLSRAAGFEAVSKRAFEPRYNIAPGHQHWVCHALGRSREVQIEPARWGLPGHDDTLLTHLRCEILSSSRGNIRRASRCAIPIAGFYAHSASQSGRQPLWFHTSDGGVVWAAGVCGVTESGREAFALVTCRANALVSRAQERMPVILPWTEVPGWLDPDADESRLMPMFHPAPAETLEVRAVSRRVQYVDLDDPLCIAPLDEATQLSLL
jgi:putative SOS response-associated peptidase YedK